MKTQQVTVVTKRTRKEHIKKLLRSGPKKLGEITARLGSDRQLMQCLLELEVTGTISQVPPNYGGNGDHATFRLKKK